MFKQSVLFGQRCLICGQKGEADGGCRLEHWQLCSTCAQALPWNHQACDRCALPMSANSINAAIQSSTEALCAECQNDPPPFQQSFSPFRLEQPIDALHRQYKFHHNLAVGRWLATRLDEQLPQDDLPDCIVPVPLHWRRHLRRGFNQATGLIAQSAKTRKIELLPKALKRRHATPPQSGLDKKRRQQNLRAAFEVTTELAGRDIVIFDDIVTTGSTVAEIARILKESGAGRIRVWSLARAP